MPHPDICIAGAGVIGLSLALELHQRGASVTVLERDTALSHASTAAAGMIAVGDPENPAALRPLSEYSGSLYPRFLARIEALSGMPVPFQTRRTLQAHPGYTSNFSNDLIPQLVPGPHHFAVLEEHSVDPRQLAQALLAAVRQTSIDLREHTAFHSVSTEGERVSVATSVETLEAQSFVHALGAWSIAPVVPRKGQMLTVALPDELPLRDVIRTPEIYIVPRLSGPRAGNAVIGATVEDAGFDTATHRGDLQHLRTLAAELLPALQDEEKAPMTDQWAGLRPATPDALPLLGRMPSTRNQFLATGHYRNGILLAPATASVIAQMVGGEAPAVELASFAPDRFFPIM